MPFKSQAQMKKFRILEDEGKIPKGTTDKWLEETSNPHSLPERVSSSKDNKNKIKLLKEIFS